MAAAIETENNMSAIITLTTDLGLTDAYVAALKGENLIGFWNNLHGDQL